MFAVRDILIFSIVAGLLAAGALALQPWARRAGRAYAPPHRPPARLPSVHDEQHSIDVRGKERGIGLCQRRWRIENHDI